MYVAQGHSRSSDIGFDTNRKGIYDFLLVVNNDLDRISHGFGATANGQKVACETYPCLI